MYSDGLTETKQIPYLHLHNGHEAQAETHSHLVSHHACRPGASRAGGVRAFAYVHDCRLYRDRGSLKRGSLK